MKGEGREFTLKHGVLVTIIILSGLFMIPLISGFLEPTLSESSHTVEIQMESLTSEFDHINGTIFIDYEQESIEFPLMADPEDPVSGYIIQPFLRLTSATNYLFAYYMNSGDRVGPRMMNSMETTTLYNANGTLRISFTPVPYIGWP